MNTLGDDICIKLGCSFGRMLSGDKLRYYERHPSHTVFFNACVFDSDRDQVWYGDIDLDLDLVKLQEVATARKETIYLTREQPYRWDGLTKKDLKKPDRNCIRIIKP